MKRRKAIKNSLLGLGGISLVSSFKTLETILDIPMANINVGIQLFTIPYLVEKDLKGTLELLAKTGYKEIEFFGPYPFSHEEAKKDWESAKQMLKFQKNAFYGFTPKQVVGMLKEYDLTAPSMHSDIISMRKGMTQLLDGLAPFKAKYVVVPALSNPEDRNSADDYKKLAAEFNRFGEQMKPYGMKFCYHNHGYEHINYEGTSGLDILLENTNPDLVQFELDIFWMKAADANPIDYLKKYPNRFKLMHVKDASEEFRFSGDGSTPDQWFAGFPLMRDPGDGVFDIAGIIKQAQQSGCEHFFLERDLAPEAKNTIANSFDYLRTF